MFDRTLNTIHVDMDGVIADFDRFVLENMGRTFNHQNGPADREMWDFLAGVDRLYYQLQPTTYAYELWDYVQSIGANVEILTAIPRRTSMPGAEQDKKDWVEKYFGPGIKVKVGPFSRDKWLHASTNDILIDDRHDNIADWSTKGKGIGILHLYNDLDDTKQKLEQYL